MGNASSFSHDLESFYRLDRTEQHRRSHPLRSADQIGAPMNAIGEIDVPEPG
jgi:hypothetical protein